MKWIMFGLDHTWEKASVERDIVDLNSLRDSIFPAFSFSKLTVLWSLNHKVFKSLSVSLLGWEWSGAQFTFFFAASFIYSFAELALVLPNAVDSSHHIMMTLVSVQALISHLETNKHQSQLGVCGRCSFHVVTDSSHLSQNSSCFCAHLRYNRLFQWHKQWFGHVWFVFLMH